ncbi:hypothetical protein MLD63_01280 (plasmid) [Paracoccus sp. TK19116]|uniref:Hemolysin type calcium-binding protein n=1 Tax=Paracoccus albicereus TaxID=2922394 RepID=A0ABT1MN96_9RHOB|nr:calcium-binding protein [Paracoccus albicereus]MCQ0969066.1 hypothetical protein [Paracoccus albicereus]
MDQLTIQAPLLWLALGSAALMALIGSNDDESSVAPEPEADPEPFEDAPGYDPSRFGEERIGTTGDDALTADPGTASAIAGLDGDDRVNGSDQADYVLGGEGDDTISGANGADSLRAGAGEDVIDGGEDNDVILGEAGDDSLAGGTGADRIIGGAGNDVLSGLGQSRAAPSSLSESLEDRGDTLLGGMGDDTLWISAEDTATGGEGADLFAVDHRVLQPGDPAMITDYTPGDDAVVVYVRSSFDSASGGLVAPELRAIGNAAGGYTTILADDVPVARVEGVTDPALIDLRRVVDDL